MGQEIPDLLPNWDVLPRGSIIVVVATDAPLLPQQLQRLAERVPLAIGRLGGLGGNGSGDIFIAFFTGNPGARSEQPTASSYQSYGPGPGLVSVWNYRWASGLKIHHPNVALMLAEGQVKFAASNAKRVPRQEPVIVEHEVPSGQITRPSPGCFF